MVVWLMLIAYCALMLAWIASFRGRWQAPVLPLVFAAATGLWTASLDHSNPHGGDIDPATVISFVLFLAALAGVVVAVLAAIVPRALRASRR